VGIKGEGDGGLGGDGPACFFIQTAIPITTQKAAINTVDRFQRPNDFFGR
jgi:hypothetical protein